MRSVRTVSLGLALLVAGQNGGWAQETAALETAALETAALETAAQETAAQETAAQETPAQEVLWIGGGVVLTLLLAGFWIMQLVRRIRRRVADLSESEERYRALFEGSQNGILFADVETNQFKYANPAISEILGYSREELCGMSVTDIHPPESQQMVIEAFESQFRGLGSTAFGLPCLRKDGAVIKCDVSGGSLSTPEGMFRIGFFTDVTERLKAEEEARKQTLRLKLATEATRIATWDWDLVTDDLYFSPEWKGQLGYEDNEIPNHFQEWKSRLHPDDLEETLRAVEDYLAGKRPDYNVEFRLRHKDGSYRWIYTRADKVLDDDGNLTRIFGCHVDVTQRRETEAALRASETHFRDVIEQSPVSIQIHAPDGSLIQSNPAFSNLYALSPEVYEELKEKYNVLQDEQAVELGVMPYIKKAFEGEAVLFPSFEYHGTDTLKTLDLENPVSRTCWLRTYGFPLKAENGEVKSVVFWSEDITDQKHAEDEVARYQERLRALAAELTMAEERERSRLASDLHDEVGQALALARIQLGIAIKTGGASELTPILEDVSKTVLNASRETRRLVSDLSSPSMNELGLAAAISDWLTEHIGDRYEIVTELVDDLNLPQGVVVSRDQRAILFRNVRELLTNVVKHAEATKITVRLECPASVVKITVQDDGVGFDPGEGADTTKSENGFGLFSISERMADLGGSLGLDTSPGQGCTVVLTMPWSPEPRHPESLDT